MPLDALIIPVFLIFHFDKMLIENYGMKLDAWRPLLVRQGLFASGSNSLSSPSSHSLSSFHALQELKDDLLDDTAWPVVMQLLNEDHWRSSKQIFI